MLLQVSYKSFSISGHFYILFNTPSIETHCFSHTDRVQTSLLTEVGLDVVRDPGGRGQDGGGRRRRRRESGRAPPGGSHRQPEDAPLVHAAVVVVQVAGVQPPVLRLQVGDAQGEVPVSEGVLLQAHLAGGEHRPVLPPLARGVEVHQAVRPVLPHAGGLVVPVGHLLLVLLQAVPPQGPAVDAGQRHRAAQQHHEHCALAVPVALLLTGCREKYI